MDRNDQQAINGLFSKLAHVEQQSGQRDTESDRFIQERISQQPGAPYYMAQTIVVQEQALEAAQRRIEELEYQNQQGGQRQGGGFFSSMFGSNQPPQQRAAPQQSAYGLPPAPAGSPWGNRGQAQQGMPMQPQRSGGGFLAGAAQTAMGVAGGVLLGNAIGGMFGGDKAQAAEPETATPDAEAPADDMDFGGDEEI
jgi:uncharacterized protein